MTRSVKAGEGAGFIIDCMTDYNECLCHGQELGLSSPPLLQVQDAWSTGTRSKAKAVSCWPPWRGEVLVAVSPSVAHHTHSEGPNLIIVMSWWHHASFVPLPSAE